MSGWYTNLDPTPGSTTITATSGSIASNSVTIEVKSFPRNFGRLDAPPFLRLNRRNRGSSDKMRTGTLRRVVISDIVSSNSNAGTSSIFSGVPGNLIEDVKLTNCFFGHRGLPTVTDSRQKPMPDWHTIKVPEQENGYPELGSFGPTPCHGFFIRHLKNLEM